MDPRRSLGRVRGDAPAEFEAEPHQRVSAGAQGFAFLGRRPKPRWPLRARPGQGSALDSWTRLVAYARDLGKNFS